MLKRIINLLKGALGLSISGIENRNPELLLDVEKEHIRTQIGKFNKGLAAHASLCERLIARIKTLEHDQQDSQSRITLYLQSGNRDMAAQYALRLKDLENEVNENRKQLTTAEETYSILMKQRDTAVEAARQKIESLKQSIDDLMVKKAMVELMEVTSGTIACTGVVGGTINRLREMVESERFKALGRIRVLRDSTSPIEIDVKECERKVIAEQALKEFEEKIQKRLSSG